MAHPSEIHISANDLSDWCACPKNAPKRVTENWGRVGESEMSGGVATYLHLLSRTYASQFSDCGSTSYLPWESGLSLWRKQAYPPVTHDDDFRPSVETKKFGHKNAGKINEFIFPRRYRKSSNPRRSWWGVTSFSHQPRAWSRFRR